MSEEEVSKEKIVKELAVRSVESLREEPFSLKVLGVAGKILLPSALSARVTDKPVLADLQKLAVFGEGLGVAMTAVGGKPETWLAVAGASKGVSLAVEFVDVMLDKARVRRLAQEKLVEAD